jgi:hypothetical protein
MILLNLHFKITILTWFSQDKTLIFVRPGINDLGKVKCLEKTCVYMELIRVNIKAIRLVLNFNYIGIAAQLNDN